jgi:hypothetical protein
MADTFKWIAYTASALSFLGLAISGVLMFVMFPKNADGGLDADNYHKVLVYTVGIAGGGSWGVVLMFLFTTCCCPDPKVLKPSATSATIACFISLTLMTVCWAALPEEVKAAPKAVQQCLIANCVFTCLTICTTSCLVNARLGNSYQEA